MVLKSWIVVLGLFSLGIAEVMSDAALLETVPRITVQGRGMVDAPPDEVVFNANVEKRSKTSKEAKEFVAVVTNRIIDQLATLGIVAPDVSTTGFRLYPVYEYSRRTSKSYIDGYSCSNRLRIHVADIEKGGKVMDEVIRTGGDDVRVDDFNLGVSDIGKFESEARLKAIEDAIGKVDDLLGGAGTTRGRLLRIKENRKFQSEPHKSKASQVCR
uniref:SIMPL domain-containing protein n=1 Tax=Rhodosorus marinus TaxID=101924 RepID=A0A7S2ZUU6_9RHOD|mmetsp:Transcript_32531/g.127584  ORF Transcript_32531/g.127584 Transcript_32531/m.127584 type:complete len:214 (+) Transcript_32531:275-916(+)